MSLIIPYSSIASPSCGSYKAPTAANFASLKHLFQFNSGSLTAGNCFYTDTINGVRFGNNTATATDNGDGTVTLSTNLTTLSSGSWVVPGTKKALIIALGKPSAVTTSFTMGGIGASAHGYKLTASSTAGSGVNNGQAALVSTATNYLVGSGATTTQAFAAVFDFNSATGITQYKFDGTTQSSTAATGDTTTLGGTGLTSIDAAVGVSSSLTPALVAVLHLNNLPSADFMKSCLAWMHYNTFTNLRKDLYPGLADIS